MKKRKLPPGLFRQQHNGEQALKSQPKNANIPN